MTATLYNRGQIEIPARARKAARLNQGDVLSVQIEGDGRILLVRLERPKAPKPAKARLVRRKGIHPILFHHRDNEIFRGPRVPFPGSRFLTTAAGT